MALGAEHQSEFRNLLVSRTKWSLPPICIGVAARLAALEMLYILVTPLPCSLVLCSRYIEAVR